MPETIFISYRSLDSAKVDPIVANLRSLKNPDGTPRYRVWQDKADIVPGKKGWWRQIVDAIKICKVFIFMVSKESVQSSNCIAEVSYAREINRHILSFILEGEYYHDPILGKKNIGFWDILPEELDPNRSQFLFNTGTDAFQMLIQAIDDYLANPIEDFSKSVPIPPDPRHVNEQGNNSITIYLNAVDSAWRFDFEGAKVGFRFLANEDDPEFGDESKQWINIINEYQIIVNLDNNRDTQYKVPDRWRKYQTDYLGKPFIRTGLFDPKDLKSRYGRDGETPPTPKIEIPPPRIETPSPQKIITPTRKSLELMPKPFAWVDIPAGQVTLITEKGWAKNYIPEGQSQTFAVDAFQMSKYLITNAQFDVFVNHPDGYKNPAWWGFSDEAKTWRKDNSKPRATGFAGDTMPRTNVTWYEAIAFCQWMSAQTGEAIMLPTEQEWQRAAQGDDGREYPWGNSFDKNRCNTYESGIGKTTPVTHYEGIGDSPFGVVDMIGNVWKWCLTAYASGSIKLIGSETRIVRGGSWDYDSDFARASVRYYYVPVSWFSLIGFFVACRPY